MMAAKKKGKLGGTKTHQARPDPSPAYSANQIWSAGLGAMSRAQSGGTKFFEELVREGAKLQGSAMDTAQKVVMQAFQGAQKSVNRHVGGVKGQATETWDNLEKIFQTRVQRALHQLGMPTAEEITARTRKVDELTHSVDRLGRPGPAAKKRAASARKPARKPRRSGARSSAVAKGGS
jgi:poly(hydroxyalkanoate) granule-associated protein